MLLLVLNDSIVLSTIEQYAWKIPFASAIYWQICKLPRTIVYRLPLLSYIEKTNK